MSEVDDIITDATRRIFQDLGDPQGIILAGAADWQEKLWAALEQAGLARAWVPEDLGGAGLSVAETFAILRVAGGHAVAVPLAESLLAAWALAQAGLLAPEGRLSLAPVVAGERLHIDAQGRLAGVASAVPFARDAAHLVVLAEAADGTPRLALVQRAEAKLTPHDSIAGEPRDTVDFGGATALLQAASPVDAAALQRLGAAMRAMQMAGAIQSILDMAAEYAQQRVAFGRPIGGFQAVQHLLARLAEEAAAALAAAASAAHAIGNLGIDDAAVFVEVAAAKVRAGEAAGEAALIGHQVHGAIGFTQEHPLHRYVQRLWSWRDDFGGEAAWAVQLGRRFAAAGAGGFWPAITAV